MKLFQKLLLAPAAIGLFAPLAANASEANLMDVSSYSQVDVEVSQDTFKPLSNKNPLLAGGEGLGQDLTSDFDGDVFSSTTSATFAVNYAIGSVDGIVVNPNNSDEETVGGVYDWALSTTTSFTGNDSLDVTLSAGNGDGHLTALDFTGRGSGAVHVDSIGYTSDIGEYLTYHVGFNTSGSVLYNTACVYEGQTMVMSDCGLDKSKLDEEYGTNLGLSVDVGNGLFVALGYEGEGRTGEGLLTDEGLDSFGAQVAWIKDSYGVSFSASRNEKNSGTFGAYTQDHPASSEDRGEIDVRAINAFIVPSIEYFPTISVGYELQNDNSVANDVDESTHYFIGFQIEELGNGTFGAAIGSKAPATEDENAHQTMWEAYYSYNYADGITLTPMVYYREHSDTGVDDETGVIFKSSFEF